MPRLAAHTSLDITLATAAPDARARFRLLLTTDPGTGVADSSAR